MFDNKQKGEKTRRAGSRDIDIQRKALFRSELLGYLLEEFRFKGVTHLERNLVKLTRYLLLSSTMGGEPARRWLKPKSGQISNKPSPPSNA